VKRIRARCPVHVARNGRIVQCSTMINKTDGLCAEHWAVVPAPLQCHFINARLGTAILTRAKWNAIIRAAEKREDVSAPTLQMQSVLL